MRNHALWIPLLILLAAPAVAQKVYIDYDDAADFDSFQTFQYFDTEETSLKQSNPMMHNRIVGLLEGMLENEGGMKDEANPDVFMTYHVQAKQGATLVTDTWGYGGYGPGWRRYGWSWGGGGTSTTRAYEYTEGTLIVDAWDAKTKQLIWRGSATQVMKEKPDRQLRQVEKALNKMANRWKKIREKDMR